MITDQNSSAFPVRIIFYSRIIWDILITKATFSGIASEFHAESWLSMHAWDFATFSYSYSTHKAVLHHVEYVACLLWLL